MSHITSKNLSVTGRRLIVPTLFTILLAAGCGDSGTSTDAGVSEGGMDDAGGGTTDTGTARTDAGRDAARVDSGPLFGCSGDDCDIVELSLAYEQSCARRGNGNVICWGRALEGQLGDGRTEHNPGCPTAGETPTDCSDQPTPVELTMPAEALRARNAFNTCAKVGTDWYCWGSRFYTLEGEREEALFSPRQETYLDGADDVSPGAGHACWIVDGTPYCVGNNASGQLATNDALSRGMAVQPIREVRPAMPDGGPVDAAVLVDAAVSLDAALDAEVLDAGVTDAAVSLDAALASDAGRDAGMPVMTTPLTDVLEIDTGFSYTCARTASAVYCWGNNRYRQLGDFRAHQICSESSDRFDCAPYAVEVHIPNPENITALELGNQFICALRSTGTVTCWGANDAGQLGQGRSGDFVSVVDVPGITDAEQLVVGGSFACVRRTNGVVSCWGSNTLGQLGNGLMGPDTCNDGFSEFFCSRSPGDVTDLEDATFIAAGRAHACAIRETGGVVCWGSGDRYELGNHRRGEQRTPVEVIGLP